MLNAMKRASFLHECFRKSLYLSSIELYRIWDLSSFTVCHQTTQLS